MLTKKEIKQRYFEKVYTNAKEVECSCGCGEKIKNKDRYGRDVFFINGHNGRKYEDPSQYKREWNHRNRKSRLKAKIERGHSLKAKIIKIMGGKCSNTLCGLKYNGKNACVFQCHHGKPSEKEFSINARTLISYSWKRIVKEIKKCDLLCANCHFIKENKEY